MSKTIRIHSLAVLLILSGVLFSSCMKEALSDVDKVKNVNGVQSTIGFALPLIDARVGISDIYSNSGNDFVKTEADKSFTFVYNTRDSIPKAPQFDIPADTVKYSMMVDGNSAAIFNNLGTFSQALSNYAPFPVPNSMTLKQIFIKSGYIRVIATTTVLHKTKLVISFPSMTNTAGEPLAIPLDLEYDGSTNPIIVDDTIPLNDVTIDLTDQGISYNVLPYMFELSLDKVPGNPAIKAGDSLQVIEIIKIGEYRGINGFLGQQLIKTINDTNEISAFSNQTDISVKLRDPKLSFDIANGFGTPVTFKIKEISAINTDGSNFPIKINFLRDTFSLPAPKVIGTYAYGKYSIDRTTSNIDDIINNSLQNAPKSVRYNMDVYLNYGQDDGDNFLFDTSTLKIGIGMEVPLDLKVGSFNYNKINEFTLPDETNFEINTLQLATTTSNDLPLNVRMQVLFGRYNTAFRDSFELIDSLFENGFTLSKAIVDTNGTVVSSSEITSLATLSTDKYYKLKANMVDRIKLNVGFETSRDVNNNQPYVKIYNYQSLGIKVGLKVKAKVKAATSSKK